MAEDNSVFRISVRGYNRSDVNDYIFSENRRFKAIEDEYKSTIEELKQRLDEANARADELAVKEKDDSLNLQTSLKRKLRVSAVSLRASVRKTQRSQTMRMLSQPSCSRQSVRSKV